MDPDIRAADAAPGQESAPTSAGIPAPRRASRSRVRAGSPTPFAATLPANAHAQESSGADFPTQMLVRTPRPDELETDLSELDSAPIFVDATGRRGRLIRRGAIVMLGVVGAYGVAVVLSFLGGPVPPNALLPFPDEPSAAASSPASPANAAPTQSAGNATHTGSGTTNPSPGAGPLSGRGPSTTNPSPAASPSASPSQTGNHHIPPGHVGRSASPGPSNGHGH